MTCLAALLIGGTALLALLFMAPLSNGGHHGDPVGLVPLLVVWPVVAVVLPFAGWLVRLPWHVSLAPLGVGMLVALTPPLLSAVAVATDGNGVQWALLGILLVPVGLGVWLVRAGIAHLRASEQ